MTTKTLSDLVDATGLAVLEHLEAEAEIPVLRALQCQGDVIAVPLDLPGFKNAAAVHPHAVWIDVPPEGLDALRGQHPHIIVADLGTCRWTTQVNDPSGLSLGILEASAPVHLLHPEHGGTGLAAGTWLLRRQREQAEEQRLVAD